MTDDTLDLFAAKHSRDEAIKQVTDHSGTWFERAMRCLATMPPGQVTGEEIRVRLVRDMREGPHHHNAWGALVANAIKRGHLQDTGRTAHMRTKKSHARRTPVYMKA